jgi:hypothetical protein
MLMPRDFTSFVGIDLGFLFIGIALEGVMLGLL